MRLPWRKFKFEKWKHAKGNKKKNGSHNEISA